MHIFWQIACYYNPDERPVSWGILVKIRQYPILSLATFAVLVGVLSFGTLLHAQQPSPDLQPPTQTQPTPDTQTAQTPPPETPTQSPSQQSPDQTGQQTPSQSQPDPAGRQSPSDSQAQSSDPSAGQVFTGTVVKQGSKYVLQDDSGTTYDIDHQDQLPKYEGKKIRVHGVLDPNGKMIHVQ